tara:strand:- start:11835 stop:12299 length:465 start_codon:yes stop_codon:yes gene_type:complete
MSETATTLGALGSDLAFSVSFGIARELLDAAKESGISEDELVAVVFALSVAFSAFPRAFSRLFRELKEHTKFGRALFTKSDPKHTPAPSGLGAFMKLLVDIAQKISVSISVQLLAANVRTLQPLRAVRIVSLLTVAIFFLFLEATSSIGTSAVR